MLAASQRHGDLQFLVVPYDEKLRLGIRFRLLHELNHIVRAFDLLVVDLGDHVSGHEPGAGRAGPDG